MKDKESPTFTFFALVSESEEAPHSVRALLVTSDVQKELSAHFAALADQFIPPRPVVTARRRKASASLRAATARVVKYDPGYTPGPHEVFRIRNFPLPADIVMALKAPLPPTLKAAEIEKARVRSLFAARLRDNDDVEVLFQSFQQGQVISYSGWRHYFIEDGTFTKMEHTCVAFAESLAAVYRDGTLYFKSDVTVRRFLDLNAFYRQATDGDIRHFMTRDLWEPKAAKTVKPFVDDVVRRKVAEIQFRGNLLGVSPARIRTKARQMGVPVTVHGSGREARLAAPQDKRHFKALLRLLADDFVESLLTRWRYLSNSKRLLSKAGAHRRREAARRLRAQHRRTQVAPATPPAVHVH